jgi:choline dehydrogenase-like flavoprotein
VFVDSGDLPKSDVEADVCIVGGGAAGIAVALGLLDSDLSVVLLEGGGLTPDVRGSYRVLPGRHARPSLGRDASEAPWYFGGNTNNWAANCRPLDEDDFDADEWAPYSGWPLQQDELQPFYERAQPVLGLGSLRPYDPDYCRPHLAHPPLDLEPSLVRTRMLQICPVPSLAVLHRDRLAEADGVRVILRAEAVRLEASRSADRVSAVEAIGADGRRVRVRASAVVLAGGGIENARLLLASNDVAPNGLANEHDLVGRFFMEHWWFDIPLGDWGAGTDVHLYDFDSRNPQTVDGTAVWAQLALAPELTRRERVPGLSFWFVRRPQATASIVAARMLALSLLGRAPAAPLTDARLFLTDAREAPRFVARRLARGTRAPNDGYSLRVQLEQSPRPENRVLLAGARGAPGRSLPQLEVRLTPSERNDHERAVELAAVQLGLDPGRIVKQMHLMLDGPRYNFFWHHMGTTRMSEDPARGVVDTDCRVHGVANLFVAGSSVFPTGGTGPPTLTIVALALRLADLIAAKRLPTRAGATGS